MTEVLAPTLGKIGARQVRLEDPGLLTGTSRYTADLAIEGVHHAQHVRSPMAHARITGIDLDDARAVPGVVAIYLADDLGLGRVYHPGFEGVLPDVMHRPALARDTVRFVGEIVAVVVATSAAAALDAAELIVVDYEPLPSVIDPVEAVADGAPLLFPDVGTNVALAIPGGGDDVRSDDAVRLRHTVVNHRMAVAPMEGNSVVVVPAADGRATIYASTQTPHSLRDILADAVGMPPESLHLVTPAVGGGFGGKIFPEVDYVVVLAAARRCGLPLRWVQQRNENLMTMQARDHRFEVELEATREGVITRLDVEATTNVGAYPGFGCGMVLTAKAMANGAYRIPRVAFGVRCVSTNTAPTGAFRGAGRPEATDLLERSVDMLAAELGLDPAEVRRRNLIGADEFPYTTASGPVYDTGDYRGALDLALERAGYGSLRDEQRARRAGVSTRHLGIGISCYVELSNGTPGYEGEYASAEVGPDGIVRIAVGTAAHGQGHRTTFSQIAAEAFGVPITHIEFVDGDTERVARGLGTGGSRSGQMGGSAVKVASDAVVAKAKRLAAHVLEAAEEDIELAPGAGLGVRGVPTSSLSWAELATIADDASRIPEGMSPGLQADPGFDGEAGGTAAFGCHVAVVEVDEETGRVDVARFVAVDDCGVILNPLLAEGQIHGGIAAGIAQALFEEVRYDGSGNPVNASLAEYLMPSAADLPSFELDHTVTPTPKNPLGAKGIGEGGTTGSLAAIHNAVVDAVSHLGIRHIDLPLTPQRVWEAICAARAADDTVASSALGV